MQFTFYYYSVATSLAFSVGYGLKVDSPSDPLINIAHAGAHGLASMGTPGKYLVVSLQVSFLCLCGQSSRTPCLFWHMFLPGCLVPISELRQKQSRRTLEHSQMSLFKLPKMSL